MDDPLTIVCGAIDNHVKMINEYKGVPGVQAGRLQEGYQVFDPSRKTPLLPQFLVSLLLTPPSCQLLLPVLFAETLVLGLAEEPLPTTCSCSLFCSVLFLPLFSCFFL